MCVTALLFYNNILSFFKDFWAVFLPTHVHMYMYIHVYRWGWSIDVYTFHPGKHFLVKNNHLMTNWIYIDVCTVAQVSTCRHPNTYRAIGDQSCCCIGVLRYLALCTCSIITLLTHKTAFDLAMNAYLATLELTTLQVPWFEELNTVPESKSVFALTQLHRTLYNYKTSTYTFKT